ncbi:MAG: hypothetical protein HQK50_06825 [Oligoflexia bacterium]|nr:hypothetical protein [Oligoflexia bacterium]
MSDQNQNKSKLRVISSNDIEKNQLPKENLWFIHLKDRIVGPFSGSDIKDFLLHNPQFPRTTKLSNYLTPQTIHTLYSIPEFQRRKPQVIPSAIPESNQEFFLLLSGQKNGPHTSTQIVELLKQKKILFNDLLSLDNGTSWIKVHEYPYFDRRNFEESSEKITLPKLPTESSFAASSSEVQEELSQKSLQGSEKEGIIGLAYLGRQKQKTSTGGGFLGTSGNLAANSGNTSTALDSSNLATPQVESADIGAVLGGKKTLIIVVCIILAILGGQQLLTGGKAVKTAEQKSKNREAFAKTAALQAAGERTRGRAPSSAAAPLPAVGKRSPSSSKATATSDNDSGRRSHSSAADIGNAFDLPEEQDSGAASAPPPPPPPPPPEYIPEEQHSSPPIIEESELKTAPASGE